MATLHLVYVCGIYPRKYVTTHCESCRKEDVFVLQMQLQPSRSSCHRKDRILRKTLKGKHCKYQLKLVKSLVCFDWQNGWQG